MLTLEEQGDSVCGSRISRRMSLSELLAEAGGVVGGGAALGAGAAWAIAAISNDFRDRDYDVAAWVQRGGGLGAVFGLAALVFDSLGLGP